MKLTPLDIRHKEFSRAMRGYKDVEVDEFLDDIADEFERIFNENIDYKEKAESMEGKVEQYRNIEETLKKTLVSAQQQAEEIKQNAKKEADLILRDAELKARSILNDSYAERQKIQRSVQTLKQKNEDLRYQMRSVLETYMNILDQEGELEGGDLPEGTAAVEPAAGIGADFKTQVNAAADLVPAGDSEAARDDDVAAPEDILDSGVEMVAAAKEENIERVADGESGLPSLEAETARPVSPDDEDDPFADVEMSTEEEEFKW